MSYNKDTDYQAKINEAVSQGDYVGAAKYEQSRNEKIDGENLNYEKTNKYSGWLDTTDYSEVLQNQMSSNASKESVANTLKKRIKKSSGTEGLSQYTYDDVYDKAMKYILQDSRFTYKGDAPEYKSKYDNEIRKLYTALSDVKEFSYDPYSDDVFKYYKQQYNREGKRAMQDLLGELAMNTGGIASSYAVGAAAQSMDYYNNRLTDKIPELYNDAYGRYLDDIELKKKQLDMLSKISDSEYQRYLDEMDQYNKDREISYKAYADGLNEDYRRTEMEKAEQKEDKEYSYLLEKLAAEESENERKWQQQEYENKLQQEENERKWQQQEQEIKMQAEENARKWQQQAYENSYRSQQDAISRALEKWNYMGYLDSESAEILGLPEGLHTSDYDYKQAQQYKIYNK